MASWWRARYGLARAEVPRSSHAALEYLLKHVGVPELAELDISHNFGVLDRVPN
jgi:hypothetical protein